MAKLGFVDKIRENTVNCESMEQLLGVTLMQPFAGTNSGAKSGQLIW